MKQIRPFVMATVLALFVLCAAATAFAQQRGSASVREATTTNAPVPAAAVVDSGQLGAAKFLSNTSRLNNKGTGWVNAFNTTVTLSNVTQCVKLSYTGEAVDSTTAVDPPFPVELRAVIDGVVLDGGFKYVNLAAPNVPSAVGFNWWQCGLAPGDHIVKIQFRRNIDPAFDGDVAQVWHRTLVIEYNQ